jgi:osmotically-inducible protein OsmY
VPSYPQYLEAAVGAAWMASGVGEVVDDLEITG